MPNPEKDRLDELKQYSIPTSEYWWLSGAEIAISKRFFKYWTAFTGLFVFVSTSILYLTNWWQTAFTSLATTFYIGKLWYIGWGGTLISIPAGYYLYKRRQKRVLHERKVKKDMQAKLNWLNSKGEGGE